MISILYATALAVLGAVFGSFAAAQVWRLRARQLAEDKKAGEPYDKAEYKRLHHLAGRSQAKDRSECLNCGHTLSWLDMIPVFGWLSLNGKCRYCKKPIGRFELIMELLTAALFAASYLLWPFGLDSLTEWGMFGLWLAIIVILVTLAAYDFKWQLLPDAVNFTFIGLSLAFLVCRWWLHPGQFDILSILGSLGFLSGVYAVLYVVSKGAWIGFGDIKLGIGLGLLLGEWSLAFVALFLANLIGVMLVLPGLLNKSLDGKSRIAFGPLLIVGTLLSFWFGRFFIEWLLGQSVLLI
jgi:prepilin signal peptidase PulO-like enzyme (type II secretory pathway)